MENNAGNEEKGIPRLFFKMMEMFRSNNFKRV